MEATTMSTLGIQSCLTRHRFASIPFSQHNNADNGVEHNDADTHLMLFFFHKQAKSTQTSAKGAEVDELTSYI